jgi:hypothetical protein
MDENTALRRRHHATRQSLFSSRPCIGRTEFHSLDEYQAAFAPQDLHRCRAVLAAGLGGAQHLRLQVQLDELRNVPGSRRPRFADFVTRAHRPSTVPRSPRSDRPQAPVQTGSPLRAPTTRPSVRSSSLTPYQEV